MKRAETITTCPCGHENLVQFVMPKAFTHTVAKYNCADCTSRIMVVFTPGEPGQVSQRVRILTASQRLNETLEKRRMEWQKKQEAAGENGSIPISNPGR